MFGATESREVTRLKDLLGQAKARLTIAQAEPAPTLALYRTRHTQRLARLRAHVRNLEEAIQTTTGSTPLT